MGTTSKLSVSCAKLTNEDKKPHDRHYCNTKDRIHAPKTVTPQSSRSTRRSPNNIFCCPWKQYSSVIKNDVIISCLLCSIENNILPRAWSWWAPPQNWFKLRVTANRPHVNVEALSSSITVTNWKTSSKHPLASELRTKSLNEGRLQNDVYRSLNEGSRTIVSNLIGTTRPCVRHQIQTGPIKTPDQVENMPVFWYMRAKILIRIRIFARMYLKTGIFSTWFYLVWGFDWPRLCRQSIACLLA